MWPADYESRLVEWVQLRQQAAELPLDEALTLIHKWWNRAPIVNHIIHFDDPDNWPLPWDLLAESAYCDVGKCLGLVYTILLIAHKEINSLHLVQMDNYTIVQINDGQYTLNDQPDQIIMDQTALRIRSTYNCENLKNKIK